MTLLPCLTKVSKLLLCSSKYWFNALLNIGLTYTQTDTHTHTQLLMGKKEKKEVINFELR